MAESKTVEVEVVTGWHGGPFGSKEPGDRFDYDYARDPLQLKKLGLVKVYEKPGK